MKTQSIKPEKTKKLLKQILFSTTVFLFSLKTYSADYYWVGGTGNWTDFANHWATTSGGTIFQAFPPGPADDVYFDANSFITTSDSVIFNLSSNNYCKTFDCTGITDNPTFIFQSASVLNIFGSFILDTNMNWDGTGTLAFQSPDSNNVIITYGINLSAVIISFDNLNGKWILMDDFIVGQTNIYCYTGTLNTNGKKIICHKFIGYSSSNTKIFLGESEIVCSTDFILEQNAGTLYVDADSSFISAYDFESQVDFIDFNELMVSNDIKADNCNFNKINARAFGGNGNNIKELFVYSGIDGDANYFVKAIYSAPVCGLIGENIFDTLFFSQAINEIIMHSDTTKINNLLIINSSPVSPVLFHGIFATPACIFKTSDTLCLSNLYIENVHAVGGAQFFAGGNSFDLGGNSGWQFAPCSIVTDVWPGDANYDLTANNLDVLNIGLAYGDTGSVRSGASNNWIAQPATDWSGFFQSAINKKHADCDGNGVVDNNDTLAISLNYGLTHPARLADPNSSQSPTPPLYLIAVPDTVMEGDTVEVEIYLGTQLIPVDSIYGIAFTINFDTALVDTSWMPFDFAGSWMGTPGVDLLTYDKKLFLQGKADVALTRTDHANIDGYGYLGKMGAVIVDNVGTRPASSPPYVTLPLSISNVTALTATEFYLTISTGTENVEIDTLGITGIHSSPGTNSLFSVYPNPVHKKLSVFSYWLKDQTNCTVELYDVMGEKIIAEQIPVFQNRFSIDVTAIPQGMYFFKMVTAKGTVNKKIFVVKK